MSSTLHGHVTMSRKIWKERDIARSYFILFWPPHVKWYSRNIRRGIPIGVTTYEKRRRVVIKEKNVFHNGHLLTSPTLQLHGYVTTSGKIWKEWDIARLYFISILAKPLEFQQKIVTLLFFIGATYDESRNYIRSSETNGPKIGLS